MRCRFGCHGRSFSPQNYENDAGSDDDLPPQTVKLQTNPRHGIVRGLSAMIEKDEDTALLVSNQLIDNALASANLLDDPREMIARSYQALEKLPLKFYFSSMTRCRNLKIEVAHC